MSKQPNGRHDLSSDPLYPRVDGARPNALFRVRCGLHANLFSIKAVLADFIGERR